MSPILSNVGNFAVTAFGFTRGGSATGWVGIFNAYIYECSNLIFTSSGNIYTGWNGYNLGTTGRYIEVAPDGTLTSNKYTVSGGSPISGGGGNFALDSSGNIFWNSWFYAQGLNFGKTNSSFAGQWQKANANAGHTTAAWVVDSTGNPYYISAHYDPGIAANRMVLRKYDTNGNLTWQRQLSNSQRESHNGANAVIDSNNNFTFTFTANNNSTPVSYVAQYSAAGVLQWQRVFSVAPSYSTANFPNNSLSGSYVAVDGSNNVYVLSGRRDSLANAFTWVTKFNSSGTLQWIRRLQSSTAGIQPSSISADPAGNVYIACNDFTSGVSNDVSYIIKYDTSGNLQWKNVISRPVANKFVRIHRILANNNFVYFGGFDTDYSFMFKYPTSGGLLGSYTVGASSYTIADATNITSTTPADTWSAGSLTDAASSLNITGAYSSSLGSSSETITTKVIP